jgi:hypothetical protein
MITTENKVLALLAQSPKTWRELSASFKNTAEFNDALLQLDKRGQIRYSYQLACYEVVSHD